MNEIKRPQRGGGRKARVAARAAPPPHPCPPGQIGGQYAPLTEAEIQAIKDEIKAEIAAAVEFAEAGSYPDPSELYTENYVQEDYPFIKD